jgi:hypothetical protein
MTSRYHMPWIAVTAIQGMFVRPAPLTGIRLQPALSPVKGSDRGRVPLDDDAAAYLERWCQLTARLGELFVEDGEPLDRLGLRHRLVGLAEPKSRRIPIGGIRRS